jgi:hypothetical protein
MLRIAAWLAPADVRTDWLREWRAELHNHIARYPRGPRRLGAIGCVVRCSGAYVHAAWLRCDRWRVEMLLQDFKYAVRGLVKQRSFALITILTLGVGIGANAAIFSAVHAVLLRPLAFPNPDGLVQIYTSTIDRRISWIGVVKRSRSAKWPRSAPVRFRGAATAHPSTLPTRW